MTTDPRSLDLRRERAITAAKEYRRRIKAVAPVIQIVVGQPELLEPIKEAARALDAALDEL